MSEACLLTRLRGFIIVIYKARQPLAAISPETRKIAYIQYSQMGSFSQS